VIATLPAAISVPFNTLMAARSLDPDLYINRELSWIAFNQRVLAQALDQRTPLLEQAKFSAIFSNNLDEFFMVRVASLKSQVEAGISTASADGRTPQQQLKAIRAELLPLLEQQQKHYLNSLKTELNKHAVQLLDYAQLNEGQRLWIDNFFQTAIFPVLTPLAVDPAHPFPFVSNLSLNVGALVVDPDSGQRQLARVKVPQKILPRFVAIPTDLSDSDPEPVHTAVPLEQVVAFNIGLLFPGMTVEGHYFFRVTRDADLELRDLEADDLMIAIEQGLHKRRMGGEVVRLEVANQMPDDVIEMLMDGMSVAEDDLYRVDGPLGLDDLFGLLSLPLEALKDEPLRDPAPRCASSPSLRPLLHVRRGIHQSGSRRPPGDGDQDDPLQNLQGFTDHRGPHPCSRARQASDGPC
jgi:polyphosphate kinase